MIVDSGVFVAAANEAEPQYEACVALLREANGRLVVPALVIAEVTFLIERAGGPHAEAKFLRSLRSDRYQIEPPTGDDVGRMATLVEEYADLPLGGTDASVIAVAERLGEREVATLDRRHFSVVRPRHVEHFSLLPDLS